MANNKNIAAIKAAQLCMKKAKAFDIIKNKGIDLLALLHYVDVAAYNFSLRGKFEKLTEEEFKLLKDLLC